MKRSTRYAIATTVIALGGLGIYGFTAPSNVVKADSGMMDKAAPGDIIDVATGKGMQKVTTLVAAVKAAGLVEALKGPGPFTVFAPTNEAFAKLPPETLKMLLMPENKDKLTKILLYHVHSGSVAAADLKEGELSTLNGKMLHVKIEGPTVTVNNATVTKTDVHASNGTIHWVDTVIIPE